MRLLNYEGTDELFRLELRVLDNSMILTFKKFDEAYSCIMYYRVLKDHPDISQVFLIKLTHYGEILAFLSVCLLFGLIINFLNYQFPLFLRRGQTKRISFRPFY